MHSKKVHILDHEQEIRDRNDKQVKYIQLKEDESRVNSEIATFERQQLEQQAQYVECQK